MPWMIPPSTWLRAPSGLTIAADVVHGGDPLDAHLAGLDVDGDLGHLDAERVDAHAGRVRAARALAEDLRVAEQSSSSSSGTEIPVRGDDRPVADVERRLARRRTAARRSRGSAASRRPRPRAPPGRPTAWSTSRRRASRTRRGRSRRATTSTRSSGTPSSSAAICAITVDVPVPMSCIAVTTAMRPSEPTRVHAYDGGPPPPYQIWLAMPMPCFHVGPERARTSCRRSQCFCGELVARGEVLRRVRRPVVRVRVVHPPQLERVDIELRGELVDQSTRARTSPRRSRARGTASSAAC